MVIAISMRDRYTNELLPYGEVVQEAKRLGLTHPKVFSGSLGDAFRMVDQEGGSVGEEGYVIHDLTENRYFKLKYPGGSDLRGARKTKGMLALDKKTRIQAGCRGIAIGENGVLPSQQEVRIKQPLAKEGHHNVVCYSIGPVADNLGSL